MKRSMHAAMALVCAMGCVVAGCASHGEATIKPANPQSYADGFEDGCYSGKKAGQDLFSQFMKDLARFDTEKTYAQGWSDGFRQCETEQEAFARKLRIANEGLSVD